MKKRSKILIIISLVLVLAAVVVAILQSEKTEPVVIEVGNSDDDFLDRTQLTTEECFERADLVVRGTYRGVVEGFPLILDGKPMQFQELAVEEIYKGTCDDTLVYVNVGGEVNVKDYVKAAKKEGVSAEKVGPPLLYLDYLKEDYPDLNVIYRWKDEFTFVPEEGQEYLVFLNWFEYGNVRGAYTPMNALYGKRQMLGMRKVNADGDVQNPYSYRYEALDFMQKQEN